MGDLILAHVVRVDVQADHLVIELRASKQGQPPGGENGTRSGRHSEQLNAHRIVLRVSWQKPPSKRRREIMVPQSGVPNDARPIRAETRATLVASIARGRRWLDEIVAGGVSVEQIAACEQCSIRQVNMTILLAFLAPRLVQAALEGRLPGASASLVSAMLLPSGPANMRCSALSA
jgi:site-specific DNA recombinase